MNDHNKTSMAIALLALVALALSWLILHGAVPGLWADWGVIGDILFVVGLLVIATMLTLIFYWIAWLIFPFVRRDERAALRKMYGPQAGDEEVI